MSWFFKNPFKKQSNNDTIKTTFVLGDKEVFLIHYLHHRKKAWGIDGKVKDLFDNCSLVIDQLYQNGYLIEDQHTFFLEEMKVSELKTLSKRLGLISSGNKDDLINNIINNTTESQRASICDDIYYVLSPLGHKIDNNYINQRKQTQINTKQTVENLVKSGDYIDATLAKASDYSKMVIAPGIGVEWSDKEGVTKIAEKQLSRLSEIDFSDINNSNEFKEKLLKILYYDEEIENNLSNSIDKFISENDEKINCSLLDQFLDKYNFVPPEKLKIYYYLDAKRWNNNMTLMRKFEEKAYNNKLKLGVTNASLDLKKYKLLEPGEYRLTAEMIESYKEIDEYKRYSEINIPGFPKTFKTYKKHKTSNSEKYNEWMEVIKKHSNL